MLASIEDPFSSFEINTLHEHPRMYIDFNDLQIAHGSVPVY